MSKTIDGSPVSIAADLETLVSTASETLDVFDDLLIRYNEQEHLQVERPAIIVNLFR